MHISWISQRRWRRPDRPCPLLLRSADRRRSSLMANAFWRKKESWARITCVCLSSRLSSSYIFTLGVGSFGVRSSYQTRGLYLYSEPLIKAQQIRSWYDVYVVSILNKNNLTAKVRSLSDLSHHVSKEDLFQNERNGVSERERGKRRERGRSEDKTNIKFASLFHLRPLTYLAGVLISVRKAENEKRSSSKILRFPFCSTRVRFFDSINENSSLNLAFAS